jgi:hypothetical protein
MVESAAGDILRPEEHIADILIALSQVMAEDEMPVLAAGPFVFAPNVDRGLDAAKRPEGPAAGGALWGIAKGGEVLPLVPDFDPASEDKDPDIETRFQEFLQALGTVADKPGEPAFVVRKSLYRLLDGFLDVSELPAEIGEAAGPGWLVRGTFLPLASEYDVRTVVGKAGTEQTLTEEQVALVLEALAKADAANDYVYLSGGRLFRLERDGRLVSRDDAAAAPVTWPLAHNVRPAQQSLGRNGCTDCHSVGSDFFFDTIRGTGPLLTQSVQKRSTTAFMGLGGFFQRIFGLSFVVRPVFKVVLAVAAAVVGALLVLAALVALGRVAGFLEKG